MPGENVANERDIPEPVIPSPALEFKYIECDHDKYSFTHCKPEYWHLFMKALKRYEGWNIDAFMYPEHDDARHFVDVQDERVDSGPFDALIDRFEWAEVWQFGLGHRGEGKRVLGILVDATFYIVLLDDNHQAYSDDRSSVR